MKIDWEFRKLLGSQDLENAAMKAAIFVNKWCHNRLNENTKKKKKMFLHLN